MGDRGLLLNRRSGGADFMLCNDSDLAEVLGWKEELLLCVWQVR
jgi:hypothetical protein